MFYVNSKLFHISNLLTGKKHKRCSLMVTNIYDFYYWLENYKRRFSSSANHLIFSNSNLRYVSVISCSARRGQPSGSDCPIPCSGQSRSASSSAGGRPDGRLDCLLYLFCFFFLCCCNTIACISSCYWYGGNKIWNLLAISGGWAQDIVVLLQSDNNRKVFMLNNIAFPLI